MNLHFILDYETLGQSIFKAPLVNCSYFIFDWDRFTSETPYTFNELVKNISFRKFNIKTQIQSGYKYKTKDVEWWEGLGSDVSKQLKPSSDDILVEKFVKELYNELKDINIKKWWSRANCFDPCLLQRSFEEYMSNDHLNEILPFWKVRDVRTYIDSKFDMSAKKTAFCPIEDEEIWAKYFIEHNSIHDVAADILRIQKIERTIHCED